MIRLICSIDCRSGDKPPEKGLSHVINGIIHYVNEWCGDGLICQFYWNIFLPWQQNIFSSTMAATGRQLKQSVNVFHSLILYLRLPKKFILSIYWLFDSRTGIIEFDSIMDVKIKLLTLVVKPIDTVDGCAFMISA